jgi:hypothetical protein
MALRVSLLAACVSVVLLAGCGGRETASETPAADPPAAEQPASEVPAAPAPPPVPIPGFGASVGDLPAFVEVFAGGTIVQNMKLNTEDQIGGSVVFTTTAPAVEVLAFYRASFARHGLEVKVETASADVVQISAEAADKARAISATIMVDADAIVTVSLLHTQPKA